MRTRHHRLLQACFAFGVVLVLAAAAARGGQGQPASLEARVDKIFDRWTASTPGCAVGVAVGGKVAFQKAYGMADLERNVRNTPDTIFEAGSVSKQFTAAAVLLLARDGKLSLDDPARKYLPELPDYDPRLTIRHMLQHTSGLRDWGSVAGIAGWPRTSRVYTHAHVLDIVSRQRSLNFPPGTRWSYSNTGYNLAAIIVSRVSGEPFASFTRRRLFEPLGMTRTSWRDDHTRIVPGRAMAYAPEQDGFSILMPFENVHGNGGILTTVGDLLRWNENFVEPEVGDATFVREQQTPGRFNDGRAHDYALGLTIGRRKGVDEVSHGGATAGYRAFLSRYPDPKVSVAVLCNVGVGDIGRYAGEVADVYLANHLRPGPSVTAAYRLTGSEIEARAGLYRHIETGVPLKVIAEEGNLRVEEGPKLYAQTGSRFLTPSGQALEIDNGTLRRLQENGMADTYERVPPASPTPEQLAELAGTYESEEAEAVLTVVVENGGLVMRQRPDRETRLKPLYSDAFDGRIGLVRFRRDANGRVTALSVAQDRVWDLRFVRKGDMRPSI